MVEKYWLIKEFNIDNSEHTLHLFNDKDIFDVLKTQLNCLEHGDFYLIKIQRLNLSELARKEKVSIKISKEGVKNEDINNGIPS